MARLRDYYNNEVAPALMKKFEFKSPMQIPKLDKVVINIGAGDAKDNAKVIDNLIYRRPRNHHRSEGSSHLRKKVGS